MLRRLRKGGGSLRRIIVIISEIGRRKGEKRKGEVVIFGSVFLVLFQLRFLRV